MISYVRGKIINSGERQLILDVAGIGYKIAVTTEAREKIRLGDDVSFWTHLAVRDDALDLYGFMEKTDCDFFELLITVSGIGPKSALGIMNVADVKTLHKAISTGDTSYLTKVSGIGKKTAEKIVRELKEKIAILSKSGTASVREEVDEVEALKSLGYSSQEAREALARVDSTLSGTGERVKAALKNLGRKS